MFRSLLPSGSRALCRFGLALGLAAIVASPVQAQTDCVRVADFSEASFPNGSTRNVMAFDSHRGVMVALRSPTAAFETWEFDGGAWRRSAADPGVIASFTTRPQMVFDSRRNVCVLFDGFSGIYEYNGLAWTRRPDLPDEVFSIGGFWLGACMTYDEARGVTVFFGGVNADGTGAAFQSEWNGTFHNLWEIPAPPGRYLASMTYDANRHVCVLFGGRTRINTNSPLLGDTWEFNGAEWVQRTSAFPSPPSRFEHSLAYDHGRGVTVLFAGNMRALGQPIDPYVWEWNGSNWRQRLDPANPAFVDDRPAIAYDTLRDRMMILGNFLNMGGEPSTTREILTSSIIITSQPVSMQVDAGRNFAFSVGAAGPANLSYQWRLRGEPIPGATQSSYVKLMATAEDTGIYDCVISGGGGGSCGHVVSGRAILSVNVQHPCPADFNQDDFVNPDDLADFITTFFLTGPNGCS